MGKGIELARTVAPEHAAMIDNLKDQLLIVFLRRLGGRLTVPVKEVDDTGGHVFSFKVDPTTREFTFVLEQKQ